MNKLRQILKDQRGVAFPLIIAIVLVLVMLMCCISEYFRLLIVAQGVRDVANSVAAVSSKVISTVAPLFTIRLATELPKSNFRQAAVNLCSRALLFSDRVNFARPAWA